ncbi:MAG: metalloregulator ArsR/SmtB family transcription factor [Planctomycetes bacterium]|nr:metalloregulator ArsR/SmtB family transcription factor [Planctomycetota bacterium]
MIAPTAQLGEALRLFGEPTRLRILGLLELSELSVGELARALGMQQSRVSNHLRLLRDAHLLQERHEGRTTFLRLDVPEDATEDLVARLWSTLRAEIPTLPEFAADVARLHQVIAERRARSRDFFDRVAGEWEKIGVDFATGQARQRAAANLFARPLVLADLGCGTGYLASGLAGLCSKLVCVDSSSAMLEEARKKLEPMPPGTELELRRGDLDELPIADGELDGCVAGMVLHHLEDPATAVREMRRVLKPGSNAVVLELAPHREEWMRDEQGDRHLGLDPSDVRTAFERAGFVDARIEAVEDRYQPKRRHASAPAEEPALALYIVRGRVPSGG